MHGSWVLGIVAAIGILGSVAAAAGKPEAAVATKSVATVKAYDDGWPDTREGAVSRRWVTAFSSGEDAMREFYLKDLARESRVTKPVAARMARYRELRERFGKLVFGSVVKAVPGELTVSLIDADAAAHTFVFKVRTESPYQMISVGMLEMRPGGHGGGFNH